MDAVVGLWMYMEKAGSPRALLLLLVWAALLAADWGFMVRGVRRKSGRTRRKAYALTALSLLLALATDTYFRMYDTGPVGYGSGYWDPVWEALPAAAMSINCGVTLFGFLCWGFCRRTQETAEESNIID